MADWIKKTTADQKELITYLPKKHVDVPQDLYDNILWTDQRKSELFGRFSSHYIWHVTNTTFY